ncbi:MAG: heme o synthase [Bacteroidota bacterium]|nr:heme o synthase [Bacteroidota bacterium]
MRVAQLFSQLTYSDQIIKAKAYIELLKVKLTSLVLFSGAFGYFLGCKETFNLSKFLYFLIGGFLLTGAANIINQIIEKDLDKLMYRTASRPLPSGRVTQYEAMGFSILLFLIGFGILISKANVSTAFFTVVSLLLYAFVYTPMKQITPFCVLVGAFPGAMPPLIGWIAGAGKLEIQAIVLFSIQFIWQFPHFWAIAWILDEDYKRAGFKMLPSSGGKNKETVFQIIAYTFFLIPFGLLPYFFHISGWISAVIVTICGIIFFFQSVALNKSMSDSVARKIMFGSFIYLPIIQLALILDKI